MQIYPYNTLNYTQMLAVGFVFDTDIPESGQRSIHSLVNDSITARLFTRTYVANTINVKQAYQYIPTTDTSGFGVNKFYPTWQQLPVSLSTIFSTIPRVIPKVRLAPYDARNNNLAAYNESVTMTVLGHRLTDLNSRITSSALYSIVNTYNRTEENYVQIAEYDFGAEIEPQALVGFSMANSSVFAQAENWLQALIDDKWVDAVNITAAFTVSTVNWGAATYTIPVAQRKKAQKFRLVNKAASPVSNVLAPAPFGLFFYGTYTAGVSPRTLGKFKSMAVLPIMNGSSYVPATVWNYNFPVANTTPNGRYMSQTHLSITDDVKQAATKDLFMSDPTWTHGSTLETPIPSFRVVPKCITGRAV